MVRKSFYPKNKPLRRKFVGLREQKIDQMIFSWRRPGLAGGSYYQDSGHGNASCYPCARADDGWERLIIGGYFIGPRVRVNCDRPSLERDDIPEGPFRTLFDKNVKYSPEVIERATREGWVLPVAICQRPVGEFD